MRFSLTGTSALALTVVDDEPSALDVLVRAARSWRYECQAAHNAEHALHLLENQLTPIVVTDLRMPGRGGLWLVREIQQRWPEVTTIVITAGQDEDAVNECLRAGAHHYFLKPVRLDEFRHALDASARIHVEKHERERYRRHLERTVLKQNRQVRRTFLSAIDSLVRTLEARDPYTSGHSLRVREYALRMATVMRLDLGSRKRLSLAAKLHDIGKVGVPEAILNKPTFLTEAENSVVREHPVIGERILSPIIRSQAVLGAIRGHHERYDGAGYPDGLGGDEIPILARIITIADCFDAMTSSRAYRQPLPRHQAIHYIRTGAGTQFDPDLIPVFTRMIADCPL